MIQTKSHDYAWNKGWIKFEAPNAQTKPVDSLRNESLRYRLKYQGEIMNYELRILN